MIACSTSNHQYPATSANGVNVGHQTAKSNCKDYRKVESGKSEQTKVNPFHTNREILKLFILFVKCNKNQLVQLNQYARTKKDKLYMILSMNSLHGLNNISFLFIIKFRYIMHTLIG